MFMGFAAQGPGPLTGDRADLLVGSLLPAGTRPWSRSSCFCTTVPTSAPWIWMKMKRLSPLSTGGGHGHGRGKGLATGGGGEGSPRTCLSRQRT